jgi:hypothetical protein
MKRFMGWREAIRLKAEKAIRLKAEKGIRLKTIRLLAFTE